MKTSIALAQQYRFAASYNDEDVMIGVEAEFDRRDTELAQLRAELARLKPLADAAVAWMASNSDESLDASTRLKLAAAAYARAQAQAGEAK